MAEYRKQNKFNKHIESLLEITELQKYLYPSKTQIWLYASTCAHITLPTAEKITVCVSYLWVCFGVWFSLVLFWLYMYILLLCTTEIDLIYETAGWHSAEATFFCFCYPLLGCAKDEIQHLDLSDPLVCLLTSGGYLYLDEVYDLVTIKSFFFDEVKDTTLKEISLVINLFLPAREWSNRTMAEHACGKM